MCGLAAILALHPEAPPVDRTELARMSARMIRRGPDGEGTWVSSDERIGLAHRRLAIIDLSDDGAQPMVSQHAQHVITYNGEIYNYKKLRAELEAKGETFQSHSDTEVILKLYDYYGPDMVSRLRGMFAIVIWDAARGGVFMARDPFGIKPLYYAHDGKTLRAASMVKALMAGGGIADQQDPAALVGFHLFGYVPEPFTIQHHIKALPAGHSMWADANGVEAPKAFFSLKDEMAAAQGQPWSQDDVREALLDTVRHHMIADVDVGVFLSAGRDSATLVGLAAESVGESLRTMTLAFDEFDGTDNDETPLARDIAAHYGVRHEVQRIQGATFRDHLDDILDCMDQPTVDGVNVYFIARAAREKGLKVALSGLGGDELFGGYNTFTQVPKLVNSLGWLPGGKSLGTGFRKLSAPLIGQRLSPKYAGLLELGTRIEDAYLLRRGLYMPWELPDVLDPDLVREGWSALDPLIRMRNDHQNIASDRLKIGALETGWYMRNQLLRDADWAGMAHSLEIRTPLVDIELFRRCLPWIANTNGPTKAHMALTPMPQLPDAVLNRPKTGFFIPVRDWLLAGESDAKRGLRGWMDKVITA